MAYVPQEAWVQNTSVVENVCFRQKLDPLWLERVLEACALWPDVSSFPAGVHTKIGEQVRVLGTSWHREASELRTICLPDLWGHVEGGTKRRPGSREMGQTEGLAQG